MKKWACSALVLSIATAVLYACSSDPVGTTNNNTSKSDAGAPSPSVTGSNAPVNPDSGLGKVRFEPDHVFTGFDGTHAFKAPIAVYDADSDLKVTAEDPSAITIAPVKLEKAVTDDGVVDNGAYFMLTAQKAGTFTIIAESGGKKVQATVEILSYDAGRWETGQARYTNAGTGQARPCTDCHVNGDAIDHSPAALASSTDEAIRAVITTGISTSGFPIQHPSIDPSKGHVWDVTETQLDGLVTYLRALDPRGFKPR